MQIRDTLEFLSESLKSIILIRSAKIDLLIYFLKIVLDKVKFLCRSRNFGLSSKLDLLGQIGLAKIFCGFQKSSKHFQIVKIDHQIDLIVGKLMLREPFSKN